MLSSNPIPPMEGIGFYIWNLSQILIKEGHQVSIITRGNSMQPAYEEIEGIQVWRPRFIPAYPFHVHLHSRAVNKVITQIDSEVDIYHLHSPLVPVVKTSKPVLLTVHSPMWHSVRSMPKNNLFGLLSRMQLPFSVNLEKQCLNVADHITVVARSVAQELSKYGIEQDRISLMGNAVDDDFFHPPLAEEINDSPTIFTAGRLAVGKGLGDLIEAARIVITRVPGVQFRVAGQGLLRNTLERRLLATDLAESFQFLGQIVQREDLADLYRSAAIYAHPALHEGLPTTILEAMACGRAVVATAVSGTPDVIRHGENGFLVSPRKPKEMAAGILKLLKDRSLRERMGQAARATIEKGFSWKVIGDAYMQIYEELNERGYVHERLDCLSWN